MSMVTMGVPCAALRISRRLCEIASLRCIPESKDQKKKALQCDALWVTFLPIFYAALTIISQGHRFNIVEGQGCQPAIYFSPITIVIDYGMPLIASFISIIYSSTLSYSWRSHLLVMALFYFFAHKKNFESILSQSGSGLSTKKFLKMISFTLIDLILNFPTLLADFSLELTYSKILPFVSWSVVHSRFGDVWIYTSDLFDSPGGKRFLLLSLFSAWTLCATAIIFFLLFGFSLDARSDYDKAHARLKSLFRNRASGNTGSKYVGTLTSDNLSIENVLNQESVASNDLESQHEKASDNGSTHSWTEFETVHSHASYDKHCQNQDISEEKNLRIQ